MIELDYKTLEEKRAKLRDSFSLAFRQKVYRALSWLKRAEEAKKESDHDYRFVCLWIAFNAAYAKYMPPDLNEGDMAAFQGFLSQLVAFDQGRRIQSAICSRYSNTVRTLMNNRYISKRFWDFQHGQTDCADWEEKMDDDKDAVNCAIDEMQANTVLSLVFYRLYTIRNQLFHGGATYAGDVNRSQVTDGGMLLYILVPIFLDIMMDNHSQDWGSPFYKVSEELLSPEFRGKYWEVR